MLAIASLTLLLAGLVPLPSPAPLPRVDPCNEASIFERKADAKQTDQSLYSIEVDDYRACAGTYADWDPRVCSLWMKAGGAFYKEATIAENADLHFHRTALVLYADADEAYLKASVTCSGSTQNTANAALDAAIAALGRMVDLDALDRK